MKISRQIEIDDLIITRFGGTHTYRDAVESLDELLVLNKGKDRIYEIVINSEDLDLQFTRNEEQSLIYKVESTYSNFSGGALAVVAYSDLVFGLSRLLQSSIQNERMVISVFRSEELARKWIKEMKELQSQPNEGKAT